MAGVIPTTFKSYMLENWIIDTRTFTYHLYTAVTGTVDNDTVIGDLTEVTDTSYDPQDVVYTLWNHSVHGTLARAQVLSGDRLVFNIDDAQDILGYYVTWNDGTTDHLVLVEPYDSPIPHSADSVHELEPVLDFGALSYA